LCRALTQAVIESSFVEEVISGLRLWW